MSLFTFTSLLVLLSYVSCNTNSDINGNTKTLLSQCGEVKSVLTPEQKLEILAAHNEVRRQDGADQLELSYDESLASRAQEWANNCEFTHNLTEDCAGESIGQNGFLITVDAVHLNITQVVQVWASERNNWNFTTRSCKPLQMCGHWTQLVWSRTSRVGCGYTFCPKIRKTTVSGSTVVATNSTVVFCDYSPSGNVVSEKPYIVGTSCSSCYNRTRDSPTKPGYICNNKLCVPCSPAVGDPNCKCGPAYNCTNGGTWDSGTCECQCTDLVAARIAELSPQPRTPYYYGNSCEKECTDDLSFPFTCQQESCDNNIWMQVYCKLTCHIC